MKHPSEFLLKVGFIGLTYFTLCFIIMIFLMISPRTAVTVYTILYGQKLIIPCIVISILIKLLYGFLGRIVNTLDYYLFPIDLYCTFMWVMGFYIYFESKMDIKYFGYASLF